MSKGKITDAMREKWKEQITYMYVSWYNSLPDQKEGFSEKKFIKKIYLLIKNKIDLTFHQSTTLNSLCNKYQIIGGRE